MPRETNIQIRRGSASDWASVNPTLAAGEMSIENDTRKVKVGDGTTAWNELRYLGADGGDLDLGGGGSPSPTATPVPPTATPDLPPPPTATPVPPTATPAPNVDGYLVSGAGSSVYNGTYCPYDTFNGYTRYKKDGEAYYLFFLTDYATWVLAPEVYDNPAYYSIYGSIIDEWTYDAGASPEPTLSATTCGGG